MHTRLLLSKQIQHYFSKTGEEDISYETLITSIQKATIYEDLLKTRNLLLKVIEARENSEFNPSAKEWACFLIFFGILSLGAAGLGILSAPIILMNAYLSGFTIKIYHLQKYKNVDNLFSAVEDRMAILSKQRYGFLQTHIPPAECINTTDIEERYIRHRSLA